MADELYQQALALLRQSLANPQADFREGQYEAIKSLTQQPSRLLVVQRTGWGKSIVYFLTTRLLRNRGAGPTLLISPLLALMRNQIAAAERLGLRAASINSTNSAEWASVKAELHSDKIDILLVSPEKLANDDFRQNVLLPVANRIGFFVVDEAHCISDWGHDFRPDYLRITRILQALPQSIPMLATTATANNRVVADVQTQLGPNLQVFRGPLIRESLYLQNISLLGQAARMAWLAEHVPQIPGNGIIYALTVRDADCLATWLRSQDINAHAYHSDLPSETREVLEQQLLDNEVKALVATTALGMGFDKPDLGFVIHYQRPGSVVHYYQQVGRAGRAVQQAYGILLSGQEDTKITEYFIRTAFPPEAHVHEILEALRRAENGLSLTKLEQQVNLTRGQIDKTLKILSSKTPAPVSKQDSAWYATPVEYQADPKKIEQLTQLRRDEQARMERYAQSQECLMLFLARELDDPQPEACGKCAVCQGRLLLPENFSASLVDKATVFLRRSDQPIMPRKQWPDRTRLLQQAREGRALCLWGDEGWGERVRRGKQEDGHFENSLVAGLVEMINERWQPKPPPTWITCVPSLNSPQLVPDLARRVAEQLKLPFVPCIDKRRATQPQKEMQNTYQQHHNLADAFSVTAEKVRAGGVLLIDDMVDSRWTFTIVADLLLQVGSGPVFPVALAITTKNENS